MSTHKLALVFGILLIVAVLGAACGRGESAGGASAGQTVAVEGKEFAFTPDTINAKPGEKITINFKNAGTVEHTFVIADLNFKLTAQPGQTVTGAFTAPSQTGTYEIRCDVAGHTEAGMKGQLIVK